MNTDFNLSELFDRYLENDLNILERQDFELRLKSDSLLSERFRLHKEVDKALVEDDILSFRQQLEKIGIKNSGLVQATPMVIAEELSPDIDQAILEQDIMALRDQLNRIHTSVVEEVDPVEIPGYAGIEQAILNQDCVALNKELSVLEDLVMHEGLEHDHNLTMLIRDVDTAIMQTDVMSLRSTLEEIGEKATAVKKVIPMRRKVLTYASSAVAAVFILLIAGTFLLNQTSASVSSEKTIAKYFQAYDGVGGTKRGFTDDANKIISWGIQKYNQGAYADALGIFEACISENNSNEPILLYAGSSAMLTGDPDKALRYFANWDSNSLYIDQVEWYTAGCYLKKNDIEKAKTILKKISEDSDNTFNQQAKAILKKF